MAEGSEDLRRGLLIFAIAVAGFLVSVGAEAHDYWLAQEPSTLEVGDTCSIRLLVGDRLESELERPLQREITTRHEWLTANGSIDLLASLPEGAKPVFERSVTKEETALLVMDRDFVEIETTYGRFAEFLEHEEATELIRQVKATAGDTEMRRRYARNLKALVRVGAGDTAGLHGRQVGQKLEILLLNDPWKVQQGERLNVQILFEREPLAGQLVKGFVGGPTGLLAELKERTDESGTVSFAFERSGLWVIRVAHVRPCEECEGEVWDTHYATFSLQLPDMNQGKE